VGDFFLLVKREKKGGDGVGPQKGGIFTQKSFHSSKISKKGKRGGLLPPKSGRLRGREGLGMKHHP